MSQIIVLYLSSLCLAQAAMMTAPRMNRPIIPSDVTIPFSSTHSHSKRDLAPPKLFTPKFGNVFDAVLPEIMEHLQTLRTVLDAKHMINAIEANRFRPSDISNYRKQKERTYVETVRRIQQQLSELADTPEWEGDEYGEEGEASDVPDPLRSNKLSKRGKHAGKEGKQNEERKGKGKDDKKAKNDQTGKKKRIKKTDTKTKNNKNDDAVRKKIKKPDGTNLEESQFQKTLANTQQLVQHDINLEQDFKSQVVIKQLERTASIDLFTFTKDPTFAHLPRIQKPAGMDAEEKPKGETKASKYVGVVMFAIFIVMAIGLPYELTTKLAAQAQDKSLRAEIVQSIQPDAILRESCMAIRDAAEIARGIEAEQRSSRDSPEAIPSFAKVYNEAYAQATKHQIELIAAISITNWGTPPPLPLIPYNPQSRPAEDYTRINDAYIKEQNMWNHQEFLRPLQLQHELIGEYENSINEAAFNYMQNSTDLPFSIGSQEFASAYLGFSVHVGTPTECAPYIRESKATVKLYARSRMHHAARKLELKLAAYPYFDARSSLPQTIPAPALYENDN